jgi:phosphoribosylamine--glycine ligase
MRVLVLDTEGEGTGLDIALRAKDSDHNVLYWLPNTKAGEKRPYGDGIVSKTDEWEKHADWADLIILTGNNKYEDKLASYFGKGYPIFGSNAKSAELELDRAKGQEVLAQCGVETIPFVVVGSLDEAISHVAKERRGVAIKPWGGDANSAMTCVCKDPQDAIFTLTRWKQQGKGKGQLMLQECIEGIEMGISGFFGPGGWSAVIEESFEHKRFMNDDLGENTGEMGTVIRHVKTSKLFDLVLEPLTDYLHSCNFVGDCSVNCMVTAAGRAKPMEFTIRLGWPDFCIRQEVFVGDPVEWMLDLVKGKDTLKAKTNIAVGILIAHGDFPKCKDPLGTWSGYPVTGGDYEHQHWQQMLDGNAVRLVGGKVKEMKGPLTAGTYPLVVTGSGRTVRQAKKKAYEQAWAVKIPSNTMFRTDIGVRLQEQLPLLQEHGFAIGMDY